MPPGQEILPVLEAYPAACRPQRVEALGNAGGFSGARLWRLTTACGPLCLRRWPPEHPARERLEFIQAVLWHVVQEGFTRVPLPLEASGHRGYVEHQGHLWQLEPWLPGAADFHDNPSLPRVSAAMQALAEFHRAASTFPLPELGVTSSPGLVGRYKRLRGLLAGGFEQLSSAVRTGGGWAELDRLAGEVVALAHHAAPAAAVELATAVTHDVVLQPCLRDIWSDHVLLVGDRVSGLVDFGALRAESVAGDVARLLGSLAGDDPVLWPAGLVAYEAVRPLSPVERSLVAAFDHSTVVLAGLHWLDWIYRQGRQFEQRGAVILRIQANLKRLRCLARGTGRCVG